MRTISAYLAALASAYLVAVIGASGHVIGQLKRMGVALDFSQRAAMVGHDLIGMLQSFLPMVAVGLLIGFLVAGLLARRWPRARPTLFIVAGAVALLTIHVALKLAFEITPIAAARTGLGLAGQALAGALGGWLFTRIKQAIPR